MIDYISIFLVFNEEKPFYQFVYEKPLAGVNYMQVPIYVSDESTAQHLVSFLNLMSFGYAELQNNIKESIDLFYGLNNPIVDDDLSRVYTGKLESLIYMLLHTDRKKLPKEYKPIIERIENLYNDQK